MSSVSEASSAMLAGEAFWSVGLPEAEGKLKKKRSLILSFDDFRRFGGEGRMFQSSGTGAVALLVRRTSDSHL